MCSGDGDQELVQEGAEVERRLGDCQDASYQVTRID